MRADGHSAGASAGHHAHAAVAPDNIDSLLDELRHRAREVGHRPVVGHAPTDGDLVVLLPDDEQRAEWHVAGTHPRSVSPCRALLPGFFCRDRVPCCLNHSHATHSRTHSRTRTRMHTHTHAHSLDLPGIRLCAAIATCSILTLSLSPSLSLSQSVCVRVRVNASSSASACFPTQYVPPDAVCGIAPLVSGLSCSRNRPFPEH